MKDKEKYLPWLLVLPALIIVFGLTLYPLFYALYHSTRDYDLTALWKDRFIGIENYRRLLNRDPLFWWSFWRTLVFASGALALQIPLGLGIAILLNRDFKGRRIVRAAFTLPLVAAPIAIGQVWRYMYHYEFGLIKYLSDVFFGTSPAWLTDPNWAMFSIILYDTWQWTPFIALIVLAGLQSLPQEPHESARIYGASRFQTFRYITFPMIRPLLVIVALLRLIDLFRIWDPVWALTRGGPGFSTEVLSYYLYRTGLVYFWIGYACAISLVFLYVTIILSVITLRKIARI